MATFPALFGVMFGDFGHGLVFLIAGVILHWKSDLLTRSGYGDLAKLRWMILLMGIFSTYSGLIYNEFMSLKLPFMSSCYSGKTEALGKD